jgi:hypothetical protein
MSETTKLMAYHCAEKDNSDGAGDHDCIATQLSVPRPSELHQTIIRISIYASIPIFVDNNNSPQAKTPNQQCCSYLIIREGH